MLWHFPISHYNEKIRWALDWKRIPHVRSAFAYQGESRDPSRKPSARYLGLLLAGARELQLPPDYVAWIEMFPLAVDECQVTSSGATKCAEGDSRRRWSGRRGRVPPVDATPIVE